MPADYGSTAARALALPTESSRSPSPNLLRPPWNPTRNPSRRSTSTHTNSRTYTVRDQIVHNAHKLARRTINTFMALTLLQRILAVIGVIVANALLILFLVFNEKIFTALAPFAQKWKDTTGGWTILWAMVFVTAFPPVIGYGMCGTIAGFVYGVGEGWLVYASASVVGSFCSILLCRYVLRRYVERMVAHDKRFAALTLTLKHDGLKLLCMIRLCPLPYSLSNGAMSTFETVHPIMYALATAIVSPKLFIHVFIGSRLGAIGREGGEMSAGTKAINWASVIIGGMVGAFTGWYIYQRTSARAKQLEAEERAAVHAQGGAPPPEFSDDPEAQVAAHTIAERDRESSPTDAPDYFDDEEGDEYDISGGDARSIKSYRDEFTDNEDEDVFGRGDGDEEERIGLHRNKSETKSRHGQ